MTQRTGILEDMLDTIRILAGTVESLERRITRLEEVVGHEE